MKNSTLCYLEKDGSYLMLHRVKKERDCNKGKWIGVGGKFEDGETPEECARREIAEETGLTVGRLRFRGIVTFVSDEWETEYMHLFTSDDFSGSLTDCDEGVLEWVPKDRLGELNLWQGDAIFLRLIEQDAPFFSLKLSYKGDDLVLAVLNDERIV